MWYNQPTQLDNVVISSRIRLARNLANVPFYTRMNNAESRKLNTDVESVLQRANLGGVRLDMFEISQLSDLEQLSLVERHLISHNFIENSKNRMLALSQDNSIAIMVNEEDHIRIQILANGLNLKSAYKVSDDIDDLLAQKLEFAFDSHFGYLTTCPTNLGTGLRASVMMHLPALERNNIITELAHTIAKLGMTIRGSYGEGSQSKGATYQISNQVTLGLSEKAAIDSLESVVRQVIESEKMARKELLHNNIVLVDEILRSYGTIKNAVLMSHMEFNDLISNIRLGVSEGLITDISMESINTLTNLVGTGTICSIKNKKLDTKEIDYQRANIIKKHLNGV